MDGVRVEGHLHGGDSHGGHHHGHGGHGHSHGGHGHSHKGAVRKGANEGPCQKSGVIEMSGSQESKLRESLSFLV